MRSGPGRRRPGTSPGGLAAAVRPRYPDRGLPDYGWAGPPVRPRLGAAHGRAPRAGPHLRLGARRRRRRPSAARSAAGRRNGRQRRPGNRRPTCGDAGGRRPARLRPCHGTRHRSRDGSRSGSESPRSDRRDRLSRERRDRVSPDRRERLSSDGRDCLTADYRFRLGAPTGVAHRSYGRPRRAADLATGRPSPLRRRRGTRGLRHVWSPGATRLGWLSPDVRRPRPDPGPNGGYPGWRPRHLGRRRRYAGRPYAGPGRCRPRPSCPGCSRPRPSCPGCGRPRPTAPGCSRSMLQ
jgi:hypothetical protein